MNKIVKINFSNDYINNIYFYVDSMWKDEQPDSVDIQTEDKNEIKIDEEMQKYWI